MNAEVFTPERLANLRQHYQASERPPILACGTVRDFCDSMDRLRELATIQNDLKDHQRPWMFKTLLGTLPTGGRLLEIGAGEPYVADMLARCGFEVWVVDPYDGSGRGPTEFEAFSARYPGVKFIRSQFGTQLTDVPTGGFDAIYSISVLEHIPHAALIDVMAATRQALKPGGWSIHAIDHVYLGNGSAYHLQTLELLAREHGLPPTELPRVLGAVESDPDIYFLSAEGHNLWRGSVPYDQFPMRRCISVQIATTPATHLSVDLPSSKSPERIQESAPAMINPESTKSERTSANPWNERTPFDYAGMWIGTRTVQGHINRKISGSSSVGWIEHSYTQYLSHNRDGRCLVLGANEGHVHRELRKFGFRGPIVASDIADRALKRAREKDVASGLSGIEYCVADLNHYRFEQSFDFVIAEGVLHHIESIGPCLENLNDCLTPSGQLIAVEFEGPFRFQLSEHQVRWINAALAVLPMELRPQNGGVHGVPPDPTFLARVYYVAPTEESIKAFDPSEAFSGPALKRLIPQIFKVQRKAGFGGTLLSYMTGHFPFGQANSNAAVDAWLQVLVGIEDTVIASGFLDNEFVYYACGKNV